MEACLRWFARIHCNTAHHCGLLSTIATQQKPAGAVCPMQFLAIRLSERRACSITPAVHDFQPAYLISRKIRRKTQYIADQSRLHGCNIFEETSGEVKMQCWEATWQWHKEYTDLSAHSTHLFVSKRDGDSAFTRVFLRNDVLFCVPQQPLRRMHWTACSHEAIAMDGL